MQKTVTIFLSVMLLGICHTVTARSGSYAMPFLLMDADARTAGMAGAGAILPDSPSAIWHNAASVIGGGRSAGAGLFSGPWNTDFDGADVMHGAAGYWNIDGRNAILAGVRYVAGAKSVLMDSYGFPAGTACPYDLAAEAGYARGFGRHFSVALTARYLHSDFGLGTDPLRGVSFDAAAVYRHAVAFRDGAQWSVGLRFADLGTLLQPSGRSCLPMRCIASGCVNLPFSPRHVLNLAADAGYRFSPSAFEAAAGAEYVFLKHGIVRAGYHLGHALAAGNYAAVGCGFTAGPVRCNASWRFGGVKSGPPGNYAFCFSLELLL